MTHFPSRTRASLRIAGATTLAALLAASCGGEAREPYAGYQVYEAAGVYRLRFLAPPWRVASTSSTTAELLVEGPSGSALLDGARPRIYKLVVTVEAGDARALADEVRRSGAAQSDPRPIETRSGVSGWDILAIRSRDLRQLRHAFLPRAGGVVHLSFDASVALDEPEVTEMIRSVEILRSP